MAESIGRFGEYLDRSIDLLRRRCPVHFAAARDAMRGRSAVIRVAGEPAIQARFDAPPWVIGGETGDVHIELLPIDLAVLLRGEATLEEATEDGRLRVRGDIDDLADLRDALDAWLHGAFRYPAFARMHRAYLAGTDYPRLVDD